MARSTYSTRPAGKSTARLAERITSCELTGHCRLLSSGKLPVNACELSLTTILPDSPRGWHLDEKHFVVDGTPISGGLFDFGLYFFHNAKKLVENGYGPYFYLPKMESHLEARLWNDVFNLAQDTIGVPRGTIRGTVLIETIMAAFEMDEVSACNATSSLGHRLTDSA